MKQGQGDATGEQIGVYLKLARRRTNITNLVDVGAEELFALELDVCVVVGLRARHGHLAAELDPGDGEDAAAVRGGERADVLLVVVHQGELALTDVVHRDLQASWTKPRFNWLSFF